MATREGRRPILIGNVAGSTGDRLDGLKHMLAGDTKVDALMGDWLSEFNLASRGLEQEIDSSRGFEPGFLHSLRLAVDDYLSYSNQQLKIAVNAGGLNPQRLALEVQALLLSKGSSKKVAYVTGDNVIDRIESMDITPLTRSTGGFPGWKEKHGRILTASVYIGCWGIVAALNAGADIVICGRCTDASPVIALAAWWHGWRRDDFDRLAQCLVAGRLIECGCYVCGGNFAGFRKMGERFVDLSFPIAEILADGSCIIQKQPNQNGMHVYLITNPLYTMLTIDRLTVDTVKTQFVYELQGLYYYNPDVIADLSGVSMDQVGHHKVRVWGAKGIAAPETLKIAVMAQAGFQAELSVYMTGLDAKAKAESFKRQSLNILDHSRFQVLDFQLYGMPNQNPQSQAEATVQLRVFAQAKDKKTLSRGKFLGPVLSNQLQGYTGLQPHLDYRAAEPKPYVTYFPGLVSHEVVQQKVFFLDNDSQTPSAGLDVPVNSTLTPTALLPKETLLPTDASEGTAKFGQTTIAPLGAALYSRSGDKGSNVNVGFFFPMDKNMEAKWDWLRRFLTLEKFCELLGSDYVPGTYIDRCEFPKIMAVHFVVHGKLGAGVSSTSNIDALGKNLGEYIRSKHTSIPTQFLELRGRL